MLWLQLFVASNMTVSAGIQYIASQQYTGKLGLAYNMSENGNNVCIID
jgi:hypothetical protein